MSLISAMLAHVHRHFSQYSYLLQKYLQSADSTSASYLHRNIWCLYREHTTQVSSFSAAYGEQERPEHTGST